MSIFSFFRKFLASPVLRELSTVKQENKAFKVRLYDCFQLFNTKRWSRFKLAEIITQE